MVRRARSFRKLIGPFAALFLCEGAAKGETIEILAAASATEAVSALTEAVQRDLNIHLRPTFAGSSTLAKHIAAGAPAHLFLSADLAWIDYLQARGLLAPNGRIDLLGNRLVLLRRPDTAPPVTLSDLGQALGQERLIMGDPAHVPAGRDGRQALRYLKQWNAVKGRAVYGASVRDALALLARGQGRYAIAYTTDARVQGNLALAARFPAKSHQTIIYPLALIQGQAGAASRKVFSYLQSSDARAVFEHFGFTFLPPHR